MKFLPTLGGSMSGSLGGLTASHNRGGQYFRRRSVPTNPNSDRQAIVRASFGTANQLWQTLTPTQQQAWRDYAAATPVTNTLGQSVVLTGNQAFVRCNALVLGLPPALSFTAILDAPTTLNTGSPVTASTFFEMDSGGTSILVSGSIAGLASDAGTVLIFVGNPISAGSNFFKGPYQFAATATIIADADEFTFNDDPDDPLEWFSATIPTLADEGRRYPVRFVILYDDGRVSQSLELILPLTVSAP